MFYKVKTLESDIAIFRSWFHFRRLSSKSHLPSVEVSEEVARAIENFIAVDRR